MLTGDEVLCIADALKFNPTLSTLEFHSDLHKLFQDILVISVNTQHDLENLLKKSIGQDGAQFLASEYQMKMRNDVDKRVKKFYSTQTRYFEELSG